MKCKIMEIELEEVSCVANGSGCDLSTQSTSCIGKPNSQPEFRPKFGSTLDIHNFTLYGREKDKIWSIECFLVRVLIHKRMSLILIQYTGNTIIQNKPLTKSISYWGTQMERTNSLTTKTCIFLPHIKSPNTRRGSRRKWICQHRNNTNTITILKKDSKKRLLYIVPKREFRVNVLMK